MPTENNTITKGDWTLVHSTTLVPVQHNELVTDGRGNKFWVTGGTPPRHASSSGRVDLNDKNGPCGEFFPHAVVLEWILTSELAQ